MLMLNFVVGMLLSAYSTFNMSLNTVVILLSAVFLLAVEMAPLNDGFKISLSYLFGFIGFGEFLAALFSSEHLRDNPVVIGLLVVSLFQLAVIGICCVVSKVNQDAHD